MACVCRHHNGWPIRPAQFRQANLGNPMAGLLVQPKDQVCYGELPGLLLAMQVPGYYAGLDSEGRLIELGWSKWPSLMHLAWQGQWQVYLANLRANLSRPALTVPVFSHQVRWCTTGCRTLLWQCTVDLAEGFVTKLVALLCLWVTHPNPWCANIHSGMKPARPTL